ncbi:hypothetical protein [Labedella endophytica]|uniref:Alpha/beta hydrolase n=1 Tax=Labedella endophytica TaxID=1523160 RepID=A0A3S0X0S2_9MICO|nr:hypothetical protein [Labedella endophytica]RUR03214.1 hypothetical protein ELQ94_01270 [Labedella endophytica]
MSGIDVSTGGRTSVDTDELHEAAARLEALAEQMSDWRYDLLSAGSALAGIPGASVYDFARDDLAAADTALARAADSATRVGGAAAIAASVYGGAEDVAQGLLDGLGGFAARAFGLVAARSLPALIAPVVVAGMPYVAPALAIAGVLWANPVTRRAVARLGSDLGGWVVANSRHVSNPGAVGLVRAFVSVSDDLVAGATGVPRGAAGAGLAGLASSPIVGAAARLVDTPVTVAPVGRAVTAPPPTGVADVASRIPSTPGGGPQVRIEKYTSPEGGARWAVYVGGTVELAPGSSDEAFDIESAVTTVAGEDGAAYRAVLAAMEDAGVGSGEPVAITGHSQGGLVAAAVAASGEYSVDTVVTFGAPSAQIPVVEGVTTVAVEHTDDLVPALAGTEPVDDARTVVSRDTFSRNSEDGSLFGAHSIEEYERTASLMDASDDRRLVELREALGRLAPDASAGEARLYRADRVVP